MAQYSLSFNPIWSFFDLTGAPLDDTFYLFTLQNTLPYLFSPIYQDQDGNIPWSDPIQLLSNGTLPSNLYWNDSLVYRLEIRQGNTQSAQLVYLVENYIPSGGSDTPGNDSETTENQITNPQFSHVNFAPGQIPTFTSTALETPIAPGWSVVTTGSGTITVEQLQFTGSDGIGTNPSYGIAITNNGFSTVTLRQRFNGNGALWSSQAVALSLTGNASSATAFTATVNYSDAQDVPILISNALQTGYATYTGSAAMPVSTNTDEPATAWTELDISWVGNVTVNLTSIQLVGQAVPVEIPYSQVTLEQEANHEFWYYNPKLQYKPIPSYALGWDFAFNPCQELGTTISAQATGANGSTYIADQTILFQTVNSGITATVTKAGLNITATATTSFALIQYLDTPTTYELLHQRLSTYIKVSKTGAALTGNIRLYWTATSPLPVVTTPDYDSLVTAITTGNPTVLGTWTEVPRSNLGLAQFPVSTASGAAPVMFSGWDATAVNTSAAVYFAIVVTFGTMTMADVLTVNCISLCGGDIATRPAPLTLQQTREGLGYYYETSFPAGPASGALSSSVMAVPQIGMNSGGGGGAVTQSYAQTFNQPFIYKAANPKVTFLSEGGTINTITMTTYNAGIAANAGEASAVTTGSGTIWNYDICRTSILMSSFNASAFGPTGSGASLVPFYSVGTYNYIADARPGVAF